MKFLDNITSGKIELWKLIVLYDILVRVFFAIPMRLLNEAEGPSVLLAVGKLSTGILFVAYFGAVLIGIVRSLRKGENSTAMKIFGWCYAFYRGLEILSIFAAMTNGIA